MSKGYWQERFKQMEEAQNDTSIQKVREMQEQFERAQIEIEKKINMWYYRFADNNGVSMARAKQMLSSRELKELHWNVEEYIKHGKENAITGEWEKELENASARVHIRRLEALKLEVQQEMEKLYGNLVDGVDKHIKDVYTKDFFHTAFEIQKGTGIGCQLQRLDSNLIDKIVHKPWAVDGKNFSERLWGDKVKLINNVHNSLSKMCITGAAPDKAISELSKAMKVSRNQAGNIIMTESAVFANKARQECMTELGVKEYEIVETLDGRTCSTCADMDGKHFKMEDFQIGVTAPVFHPRCRGCTCPYFDDEFSKQGERAARNEEEKTYYVAENMTYREWEKTFVSNNKNATESNQGNQTDITREWTVSKKAKGKIIERQEYIANGTAYKVDGKHVILHPTDQERAIAAVLSREYGKTVELVPQVMYPQGIQTPDYLINGERFDLKSPTGSGKNVLYNMVNKKNKQSPNFIFDITECPLSEEELEKQIIGLYNSRHTRFIEKIILMKNGKILKIYDRK